MSLTSYGANIDTSDVMLLVGQTRFYAHRTKLAERSTYFNGMFNSSMKECSADIIELKEIEPDLFHILINYCYTGSFKVTEDNACELLRASSMYDFGSIREDCVRFLESRLALGNCLEYMLLAERLSVPSLHLAAIQMARWDFSSVCRTHQFLELPIAILTSYLSRDDLRVESEADVFDAIARWIAHDEPNRVNHFESLLPLVRFSVASADQVGEMLNSLSLERCQSSRVARRIRKILQTVRYDKGVFLYPVVSQIDSEEIQRATDAEFVESAPPTGDEDDAGSEMPLEDELPSDSEIGQEFVNHLLRSDPRSIQHVPAVVASFVDVSTETASAPRLAYFDCTKRTLVLRDTITKSVENSRTASGFRSCIVGKHVYIIGGEFSYGYNEWNLNVWKYDIFSRKWSFVDTLRNQRRHHILCVLDKCIYLFGGVGRFRIALNTAEKLDTVSETWSDVAPLPQPIFNAICTSYRGKIYVIDTEVYCYSPLSNTWSHIVDAQLPVNCNFHSALSLAKGIYLLGRSSKRLFRFNPEMMDDEDNHPSDCCRLFGEFFQKSHFACMIGTTIYAFNTKNMVVESYDTGTGHFKLEDSNSWMDTLGFMDTCYGFFPMPHYAV